MTIKLGKSILVGMTFLFLTGCSTVTQNAGQSAKEIQDTLPTVVDQLNTLQTLEADLQKNWEDDIDADNTLASYAKKQDRVFDNINQRREIQKTITKNLKILNDDRRHLANLKGKDLPNAEIQIVVSNLQTIYDKLTAYQKLCATQLDLEEQFFQSLANMDTDKDTLASKIQSLNDAATERQAILEEINTPLTAIDKPIRILKARLSSEGGL